jgi:hypothetical protein
MDMLDIDWDKVDQTAVWLREQEELACEPVEPRRESLRARVRAPRAWAPRGPLVSLGSIWRDGLQITPRLG